MYKKNRAPQKMKVLYSFFGGVSVCLQKSKKVGNSLRGSRFWSFGAGFLCGTHGDFLRKFVKIFFFENLQN